MSAKQPHATCLEQLRSAVALEGIEVTISTEPPLVIGPFTTEPFVCPHGTAYWIEPTGEQVARYRQQVTG